MALEEDEIQGALIDTYVAAENKETLLDDRVFVKKILDRPFGYGVVLSGLARNVEHRCRDYIDLHISEIFHTIKNITKTLEVKVVANVCNYLMFLLVSVKRGTAFRAEAVVFFFFFRYLSICFLRSYDKYLIALGKGQILASFKNLGILRFYLKGKKTLV